MCLVVKGGLCKIMFIYFMKWGAGNKKRTSEKLRIMDYKVKWEN